MKKAADFVLIAWLKIYAMLYYLWLKKLARIIDGYKGDMV